MQLVRICDKGIPLEQSGPNKHEISNFQIANLENFEKLQLVGTPTAG